MPTDKPRIVIYTEQQIIEKLDTIAKSENRSRGNMAETILRQYIEQYEKEPGHINSAELSVSKIG